MQFSHPREFSQACHDEVVSAHSAEKKETDAKRMMNSQIIETHIITAEMLCRETYAQLADVQLQVSLSRVFGPEKIPAWLQINNNEHSFALTQRWDAVFDN